MKFVYYRIYLPMVGFFTGMKINSKNSEDFNRFLFLVDVISTMDIYKDTDLELFYDYIADLLSMLRIYNCKVMYNTVKKITIKDDFFIEFTDKLKRELLEPMW